MENTNWFIDPQRESTWLSLLPDEIILHIISYSIQPSDFFNWSTCSKRTSIICRASNLIAIMKQRFTRRRFIFSQDNDNVDVISHLPNQYITRVRKYGIGVRYMTYYVKGRPPRKLYRILLSEYDFAKGLLIAYSYERKTRDEKKDTIIVDHGDQTFSLNTPNNIMYTCQMQDGKSHGMFRSLCYNFEVIFDHGIIQSYKSKSVNIEVSNQGKVNMLIGSGHDASRDGLKVKIVDSVIIVFKQGQVYSPVKVLSYNSELLNLISHNSEFNDRIVTESDYPLLYDDVIIELQNWNSKFIYKILDISSEKIKIVDSATFIRAAIPNLVDYEIYNKN